MDMNVNDIVINSMKKIKPGENRREQWVWLNDWINTWINNKSGNFGLSVESMEGLVLEGGGTMNSRRSRTKKQRYWRGVSVADRPSGLTRPYSIMNRTRTLELADLRFGALLTSTFPETLGKSLTLSEHLFSTFIEWALCGNWVNWHVKVLAYNRCSVNTGSLPSLLITGEGKRKLWDVKIGWVM